MTRTELFFYACLFLSLYVALSRSRVLPRPGTPVVPGVLPTLSPKTLAGIFVAFVTLFVPTSPPPPPPRDEHGPPPPSPPAHVARAPDAGEPDAAAPACAPVLPSRQPSGMIASDRPTYAGEPLATGCGPEAEPLTPCEGVL